MSLFDLSVCLVIYFSLLIYVWKDTSLIPDIFSFLTADNISVIRRWKKCLHDIDFPLFLETEHKNLLTSLLACPFCISFWSSVVIYINLYEIEQPYNLFYLPLYWYGIYFLYLTIKKLEKWANTLLKILTSFMTS